MSIADALPPSREADLAALRQIEQRLLWLSTMSVHHANHVRINDGGVKVGGHQASSSSLVSVMTALYFHSLRAEDRVSVKPTAAPVLYSIGYLLGVLDKSDMETLRAFDGLQAYPSRRKQPRLVDYSTGSMGLGATATLWDGMVRRYLEDHFGPGERPAGRSYALLGDAELDEGAVWEALLDPSTSRLGDAVWIIDLNRQALDRYVPERRGVRPAEKIRRMFEAVGWRVVELRHGARRSALFSEPGGEELRRLFEGLDGAAYGSLLRLSGARLRTELTAGRPPWSALSRLVDKLSGAELCGVLRNLGGHDLAVLIDALGELDRNADRPTVILAHTIKGYGLAFEGHPDNHSAQLTGDQLGTLAESCGADPDQPWERFEPSCEAGLLCRATALRLRRSTPARSGPAAAPQIPADFGRSPAGRVSTQQAFGAALLELRRAAPEAAARVVTVSPDVSVTTNLGGWINKVGAWEPDCPAEQDEPGPGADPDGGAGAAESMLRWGPARKGQHIELGIAETNLVGLLTELGLSWSRWNEPLLPIGTVYDPFVTRALEPWSFGLYSGGQSLLVGTPAGVSLAPEGGAHQSVITASIGIEQPGVVAYEPAFATDLEWCLLAALAGLGRPDGRSAYLRLSTRPLDQAAARVPDDPAGRERRRRQVVAGGYALRRAAVPGVTLVAMGAVVPEALAAAEELERFGLGADVVCVTSADLLYRATRSRTGPDGGDAILDELFPGSRAVPMVTVLDGHPHTLAFLATVRQVESANLGVADFGQSGGLADVYAHYGIDAASIVGAALDLSDA